MSLFISGMNLSVIVFPPANPCPSSLHAHLSSLGRTQWRVLLPKSFQHQPFSMLQGEEVTPGASPVASWAQRSLSRLRTSDRGCGGRVQWLCSPEVALLRWKETWQAGYCAGRVPWTHARTWPSRGAGGRVRWRSQDRRTPCGFAERTPAGLLGWAVRRCHDAGSSFNAKNPETWGWFSNVRTHLLIPLL